MGSALKSEIQEELAYQPLYSALTLGSPSILLFDIDGVIRDVARQLSHGAPGDGGALQRMAAIR
jgi:hypothetical protein